MLLPPTPLARTSRLVRLALLASLALVTPLAAQSVLLELEGLGAESRFGAAVSDAGDVDGDGVPDVIVGAATDSTGSFKGGAFYVHSGADGSLIHAHPTSVAFTIFGADVANLGDRNGDGRADLLVGQSFARGSGEVHLFSGSDTSLLWTVPGPTFDDTFGTSVANLGDIDRDGVPDFGVGAIWDKETIWFAGAARVYSGADQSLLHAWFGDAGGDNLGNQVRAAGDVNDDGYPDVIAGAYGASANGINSGMARVYSGRDGSVLHTWLGLTAEDEYGAAVSSAGDVNADGHDDLIVGAYFADVGGVNGVGTAEVRSGADGSLLHKWTGAAGGDWFGLGVTGVGDQDGDGHDDVLVGAPHFDPGDGPTGGAILYSGKTGAPLLVLEGDAPGEQFGLRVARLADLDGDGHPEFAVGSPYADTSVTEGGRVRVFSYDGPKGPWAQLGGGLAGSTLPARLRGFGSLVGGELAGFDLNGGPFHAPAYMLMGFAALNAPFKQGVLVPNPGPPSVLVTTDTDGTGSLTLQAPWPMGLPSDFEFFTQVWFEDVNGPSGYAASNAVRGRTP
ncbi:MAG: hypothetical protein DHS20C15_29920 [Planctomycetota bacterium]|nr:MAG: hypothetical protein DHS20C15_29920 [Planctomycetota bacterium]